jgi:acyl-CoA synthetase (AMP-forming)/AMP-acid ligase II
VRAPPALDDPEPRRTPETTAALAEATAVTAADDATADARARALVEAATASAAAVTAKAPAAAAAAAGVSAGPSRARLVAAGLAGSAVAPATQQPSVARPTSAHTDTRADALSGTDAHARAGTDGASGAGAEALPVLPSLRALPEAIGYGPDKATDLISRHGRIGLDQSPRQSRQSPQQSPRRAATVATVLGSAFASPATSPATSPAVGAEPETGAVAGAGAEGGAGAGTEAEATPVAAHARAHEHTIGSAAASAAAVAAAHEGRLYRPLGVRGCAGVSVSAEARIEGYGLLYLDTPATAEPTGGAERPGPQPLPSLLSVAAAPAAAAAAAPDNESKAAAEPATAAPVPVPVYWLDDVLAADALRGAGARFTGDAVPAAWRRGVGFHDSALLIYTSGTTGLPKAAAVRHSRLFGGGLLFARHYGLRSDDRYLTPLPLYHSAATVVCVMAALHAGATVVLTRRFSVRTFWEDCDRHRATVIQYIGELCRYLLAAPERPAERRHCVRLAVGNGLRPDVWAQFQQRFRIAEVGEFYAATEGNAGLFNHCRGARAQGAVGHMGSLVHWLSGMRLVRYDVEADCVVRDPATGRCVPCRAGEAGELVARIVSWDPVRAYAGYHGNAAGSEQKVLRDVFERGDRYFRTGDLLRVDSEGFWYFVDRVGDTFRWKGENVSTNEVQEVLSQEPSGTLAEVNVYGALVPGREGRACMAAVVFDAERVRAAGGPAAALARVAAHAQAALPAYAVPLFVRELPEIEVTATFKHKKTELRAQGADPATVPGGSTVLWVLDAAASRYVPLTEDKWREVCSPQAKL